MRRKKIKSGDILKESHAALAGVAQWIERWPENGKAAGSIPPRGTCLGCGPAPCLGVCERQPITVSLSHLFLSLFLPSPSLKINKIFKEKNNNVQRWYIV